MLLRSNLEEKLDRILDRHHSEQFFKQPEVSLALNRHKAKNHVFIVLGSPVTEVLYWDNRYTNRLLTNTDWGFRFLSAENAYKNEESYLPNIQYQKLECAKAGIVKPWLMQSLASALDQLAEKLGTENIRSVATTYASSALPQYDSNKLDWYYNEFLGFW